MNYVEAARNNYSRVNFLDEICKVVGELFVVEYPYCILYGCDCTVTGNFFPCGMVAVLLNTRCFFITSDGCVYMSFSNTRAA